MTADTPDVAKLAAEPLKVGDRVWCQARVIKMDGGLYFDPVSQADWVHEDAFDARVREIGDYETAARASALALAAKDAEIARLRQRVRELERRR